MMADKRKWSVSLAAIIVPAALFTLFLLPTLAAAKGPSMRPACIDDGRWTTVSNPGPTYSMAGLYGVAVLASNDIWAVGEQYVTAFSAYQPLIEHWNGSAWSVVPGPNIIGMLRGIAAISPTDIWAVGFRPAYSSAAVILHWDGSTWSSVSHSLPGGASKLFSIAAISANDIYAVGEALRSPLLAHWNGSQWTAMSAPVITNGVLNSLTIVSRSDMWAVGYVSVAGGLQTLTLHYDGTSWAQVISPNAGSYDNRLTGVVALSSKDVWAVGYASNGMTGYWGVTLHYDGHTWSIVTNGTESLGNVYLNSIAAVSASDIWAVGRDDTASAVALHYDGTRWRIASTPHAGTNVSKLLGAVNGAGVVWAVGAADRLDGGFDALIEQYVAAPSSCL
jgi:hypothetical protein